VTANLRNDTIEATGSGGYGVSAYMGSGTETLNLTNTIIHGAGADIYGEAEPGASATVTAAYSNFATVDNNGGGGTVSLPAAGSATNQTAAPVFAQAGAGDFHELSSSPTIGAGADSALNGTTDLDGNPREIDGNTDIGAYEFVPAPTCEPSKALVHANKPGPVSLHCTDLAGAPLTYAIVTKPAHGTLSTPSSGGTATYTPAKGYSGLDRFTFEATSSHGTSAAQTALITVLLPPPGLSKVKLRGTTLSFTLNEPASVTLTFARRGHKNVIVRLKGKAGKNSYKIKKLKAGKYKLTIAAQNGGGRAKSKSISLKIKR
jgi:Bacterial Ig domain